MTAFTIQKPAAWIIEFENGEQELHFHDANISIGESQKPLYTAESLRDVLEQAARACFEVDDSDDEYVSTRSTLSNAIRAMKDQIK